MSNRSTFFRKLPAVTLALGLILSTFPAADAGASPLPRQLLQPSYDIGETYVSPEIDTESSNKIRVIVQLEGQPAAVGKYASDIGLRSLAATATEESVDQEQHEFIEETSDQGLNLDINYQYNTVLNGMEITIPANEIPKLAEIPGVKSIQENSTWYPIPIESSSTDPDSSYDINPIKQIGADLAWAEGLTGKGLKVGVVDTGVDYKHPDISPAYKGGYDSFNRDNDPYEDYPLEGFIGTSHGTHVAGTIIGRAQNTESDIVQKGIAYEADLYAYKVLGHNATEKDPNAVSGSTAQVIDGIEHAVKDGVDVINLSLGSDSNKNVNSPHAIAINNAILSGTIVVVANGNAGPDYYSIGAPATSQLAISVGAVNTESQLYSGALTPQLQDAGSVTTATYDKLDFRVMAWTTGNSDFASIMGNSPVEVVYAGLGKMNDFINKDVRDKVVLISRGDITYFEKVYYAGYFGAKAVLLFNGTALNGEVDLSNNITDRDDFIVDNLGDSFLFVPTFNLKGVEGRALARTLLGNPDQTLKVSFDDTYEEDTLPGDFMAAISARGPNSDSVLGIKPDIVAPGVNIMSTIPAYGGPSYETAYQRFNGTSMAAPHISGLALLLKQKYPDWSHFDIRSALTNTAEVLYDSNEYIYNAYEQGAGRANVAAALQTPALLQAVEPITILDPNYNPKKVINYNSSASFGVVLPGSITTKELQLKNISSSEVSYTADIDWHFEHNGVEAVLSQSAVSAYVGDTTKFQLTLNVEDNAEEGFYEGQINLSSPGAPDLHLPFVAYVGDKQPVNGLGIQELALTNSVIYPNKGTQRSTDLSFKLLADDTNLMLIEIVDIPNNKTIGYYSIEITDSINEYFSPGEYKFQGLTNKYNAVDNNAVIQNLPNGTYEINVFAAQLLNFEVVNNDSIAKRPDNSKIVYSANAVLRVDNSTDPVPGGNTGGGSGGGGGGISSPSVPQPGSSNSNTSIVPASAQAIIEQAAKSSVITATTNKAADLTTAKISDNDLKAAIQSVGKSAAAIVINVSVSGESNVNIVLTPEQIKLLNSLEASSSVIINVGGSAISLPVSLLKQSPDGAELVVTIAASDKYKSIFNASGASVIGTPVQFEANWVNNNAKQSIKIPNNVFIKRSFTIPGHVEPGTAGVLYEANGSVSPIASVFQAQKGDSTIVTVSRPGFSVYAAVNRKVSFSDISGSSAAAQITALANKFIIEGTSADKFSPNNNLTRAEFTALLVRALGLKSTASPNFSDIKTTDWYANDLAAAFEAGLIQGTGGNKFSPNAKVTRQELTVILDRALKLTGQEIKATTSVSFADQSQIAAYAKDSVLLLSAAGVISGEQGKSGEEGVYFNPNAATTRETAASSIYLLLKEAGLIE
ncbi:PA domain-containing protein [Fontibacillus panacisegetis]|uniref:PA domain-containing protein n=1 Tax=Fontibacillus panacisegetis TaxID=670482 RepID=A0A1G7IIU4_9BACL|nr:S8 family serine peptidase [Fontibacillus panacisegetis]SDF12498.1 PA domain-containing protein [Fontibacillus panacisegetis]